MYIHLRHWILAILIMLANSSTHPSSLSKEQEICVYKKRETVILFWLYKQKIMIKMQTLHTVRKRAMGRGLAGLDLARVLWEIEIWLQALRDDWRLQAADSIHYTCGQIWSSAAYNGRATSQNGFFRFNFYDSLNG